MKNLINIQVISYSYNAFLDFLKNNNISIYKFKIIDQYTFNLYCSYWAYRKIKKNYKNTIIIGNNSITNLLIRTISNKLVVFSLIISSLFYVFLSNRIMVININGVSNEINSVLEMELDYYNIAKYKTIPSVDRLKIIEKELYDKYQNTFDILSLTKKGNYIIVNYEKKKDKLNLEEKKGKIYSKKDAIISKILISSGNVLVKENQYVQKNQLIVDDELIKESEVIKVGTKGYVYGYTFNKIVIDYSKMNYEDIFIYARYKICENYILDERIVNETIIFDNENDKIMILHYKCEEILNLY